MHTRAALTLCSLLFFCSPSSAISHPCPASIAAQDPAPPGKTPAPIAAAGAIGATGDAKPEKPDKVIAPAEIKSAIQRCVAILLERQEALDGKAVHAEWPYEGVYRVGGEIPIGYRIGGTSIAATALLEASGKKPSREVREAVVRALEFVLDKLADPLMTPDFETGYDVRGWGHAYALEFLMTARAHECVPEGKSKDVDAAIHSLVERLQKSEIKKNGGWNYARGKDAATSHAATFMTAPTIQILFAAAKQGEKIDPDVIARALATLEDARLDTGSFQYGTNPEHKTGKGIEEVPGAVGRMPVCETTLYLAGRGSVARIKSALDAFFTHWGELEKRRKKTGTHEGPYKIAPYFFYYAHRYAAQAIEMLPENERAAYRQKLAQVLWRVREEDLGWNDRVFPRSESFGTSMALLALLEPELPPPARWSAK